MECQTNSVTNVFRNGRMPTKEEYTRIWIDMINHIERLKANQSYAATHPGKDT